MISNLTKFLITNYLYFPISKTHSQYFVQYALYMCIYKHTQVE